MGASVGSNHGSIIYENKIEEKKILVTLQTVLLRNTVFLVSVASVHYENKSVKFIFSYEVCISWSLQHT